MGARKQGFPGTGFVLLFLLIGAGLLVGALAWQQKISRFVAQAHVADGEVVELVLRRDSDGDTLYAPRVRFVTARERTVEFTTDSASSPPSFHEGERVRVLYDPEQPGEAKIDSWFQLWGGVAILCFIGGIFTLVGGGVLLGGRMKRASTESLRREGRQVMATFESVERNTSCSVNGTHPWRVRAQWLDPQTRKLHVFNSDNIWFDPAPHIGDRQIGVFVDPHNPKRYWMDLSFLPELAS